MDKTFNINIECEAAFEQCSKKKCPFFEMEQESMMIIDAFGHSLPHYHPHCKNMFICQNAVKIASMDKQE